MTLAIISQSASPLYCCSLVLPCTVTETIPAFSAIFAYSSTLICSLSYPIRILTETGREEAATVFSIISEAISGVRINPHPSPDGAIFLAGQPIFRSIPSYIPRSHIRFAASATVAGSRPKSCRIRNGSPGPRIISSWVARCFGAHKYPMALIISV